MPRMLVLALLPLLIAGGPVPPSGTDTCAAADPAGNHLEGALLIGLVRPTDAAGFARLVEEAPEIALVLASYGVVDGLAPQLDMRSQQSDFGAIPTPDLAVRLLDGTELDRMAIAAGSEPLSAGTSLRVDARTELLASGKARVSLVSAVVDGETRAVLRTRSVYTVVLAELPGERAPVQQYLRHRAKLYRIESIDRVSGEVAARRH